MLPHMLVSSYTPIHAHACTYLHNIHVHVHYAQYAFRAATCIHAKAVDYWPSSQDVHMNIHVHVHSYTNIQVAPNTGNQTEK